MATLKLGPLLRHVGERTATVWVETDAPCEVWVSAGEATGHAATFTVAGHHYAIVSMEGLIPATVTPYTVSIDGRQAWPDPASALPPSRIRTLDVRAPIRVLFGSCREAPSVRPENKEMAPDAMDALAHRLIHDPDATWPDILLLVGDQVYADETSPAIQAFIESRRDVHRPPGTEVANFEEYTQLYYESWGEPTMRWLLSTIPTSMIFDDHDVRDDWNTSDAWRRDMARTDWWEERIVGALMSYWIYQHLGNLSPERLARDELLARVRREPDAEATLRAFAKAADREADGAKGARWSYRQDLGPVRLLVVDSRCGRILADGRRSMIGDDEFDEIERQVDDGVFDHLVLVTSMPWLLPRALHDVESLDEALCAGTRGRAVAWFAERLRRAVDLEHWAAFRQSFDRLARWFAHVGRGRHGSMAPATICVLSGDVHHSYVSQADYDPPLESKVFQITSSPIHNTIPLPMKIVFWLGWSHRMARAIQRVAEWAKVPPLPIGWHHPSGPHFGNTLALLEFEGREARVIIEQSAEHGKDQAATLEVIAELSLT